jgi:hypothetical protein
VKKTRDHDTSDGDVESEERVYGVEWAWVMSEHGVIDAGAVISAFLAGTFSANWQNFAKGGAYITQ